MTLTIDRPYVEERGGGLWVAGTRVSLDSILYEFLEGASPETIVDRFPAVSLEQVYGSITFYLAHRETVDLYLKEGEQLADVLHKDSRRVNSALAEKMEAARRRRSRP